MSETVTGYVDHIIFRNEENGYTVLVLKTENHSGEKPGEKEDAGKPEPEGELTIVGSFPDIAPGVTICAEGSFVNHASYGRQFSVSAYTEQTPGDGLAMERYLGSGAIKGIGERLAARIVRRFGEETLRILEEEPERLAEIKGISPNKARDIASQIAEKTEMRRAMIFLQKYGISLNLGAKIYQKYGQGLYNVLQENPYRLAEDISGVGFRIADEIAGRIGIQADSEYRIRSGLLYTLQQAAQDGHVCLPRKKLLFKAQSLLQVDPAFMEKHLVDLSIDRKIVIREEKEGDPGSFGDIPEGETEEDRRMIYLAGYYHTELNTARMLTELAARHPMNRESAENRISRIERETGTILDGNQKDAVMKAAGNGVFVLTGGPGTGKTTTINAIIRFFDDGDTVISLAAPTGRAAKRMTETTGYEAMTIHRLLELSGMPGEDKNSQAAHFERNAQNPLESDVVIIDEMSMVDIFLMHSLLLALVPGTRLILVGDERQLPSVGPGNVLRDIISSGCFPVVTLTKIFRQAMDSDIVVNAHRINRGEQVPTDNKSRDFFFLKRYDTDRILRVMIALIKEKLPGYVDANPGDIQVLTPMRKGVLGVEQLNLILQKYLNPPSPGKREKETGDRLFREGDKVMQIRNNYQLEWEIMGKYNIPVEKGVGVFNGDTGILEEINEFSETVRVVFEDGRTAEYGFKQLEELELAYAVTIHKSQGSEYPAVILPLLGGPRMLMNRNLLYTAVTRAKKCVAVVGNEETFAEMIRNERQLGRYSFLDRRIREFSKNE